MTDVEQKHSDNETLIADKNETTDEVKPKCSKLTKILIGISALLTIGAATATTLVLTTRNKQDSVHYDDMVITRIFVGKQKENSLFQAIKLAVCQSGYTNWTQDSTGASYCVAQYYEYTPEPKANEFLLFENDDCTGNAMSIRLNLATFRTTKQINVGFFTSADGKDHMNNSRCYSQGDNIASLMQEKDDSPAPLLYAAKIGAKKAIGHYEDALLSELGFPAAWLAKNAINFVLKEIWGFFTSKATQSSASGRVHKAFMQKDGVGNDVNWLTLTPYNAMTAPAVTLFHDEDCNGTSDTYTAYFCDQDKITAANAKSKLSYQLQTKGSNSCGGGATEIKDSAQCQDAFNSITTTNAGFSSGSWTDKPYGCSMNAKVNRYYYETKYIGEKCKDKTFIGYLSDPEQCASAAMQQGFKYFSWWAGKDKLGSSSNYDHLGNSSSKCSACSNVSSGNMEGDKYYRTYYWIMNGQEGFWNENLHGVAAQNDGSDCQTAQKICKVAAQNGEEGLTSYSSYLNACNIPTQIMYLPKDMSPMCSVYTGKYVQTLGWSAKDAKSMTLPNNVGVKTYSDENMENYSHTYWGTGTDGKNRCQNLYSGDKHSLNILYRDISNTNYYDFMGCMRQEAGSACRQGKSQACSDAIYSATDACDAQHRAQTIAQSAAATNSTASIEPST